jgi:hypothetical protein
VSDPKPFPRDSKPFPKKVRPLWPRFFRSRSTVVVIEFLAAALAALTAVLIFASTVIDR